MVTRDGRPLGCSGPGFQRPQGGDPAGPAHRIVTTLGATLVSAAVGLSQVLRHHYTTAPGVRGHGEALPATTAIFYHRQLHLHADASHCRVAQRVGSAQLEHPCGLRRGQQHGPRRIV